MPLSALRHVFTLTCIIRGQYTEPHVPNISGIDGSALDCFVVSHPFMRVTAMIIKMLAVSIIAFPGAVLAIEVSLEDMAGELTENGIEVSTSRKGNDGRIHIAMCGALVDRRVTSSASAVSCKNYLTEDQKT